MSLFACTGDVFFTRSKTVLGRLIQWAQSDPGEEESWANHTGVLVRSGFLKGESPAHVVEALWKVRKGPLQLGKGVKVRLYRPAGDLWMNVEKRKAFQAKAEGYVGDSYGWWKLLFHLADRALFKGKKVLSGLLFIDSRPICSYLAAHVYEQVGISFGMDPDAADPDEMEDYCRTHPNEWAYVGEEEF